ncbi:MAG: type II toxin-antitoxin system Phd/YefM family antitoxin [Desmonostoc geniculatum HA4340-LM1]|nr:type II toxin-antitoxin system Phd/YefM family antitoxin [Desmonostoc geniculatum HA4340-LM1]
MLKISVEEAALNLKHLVEQVAKGEEVILLKENRVVARLVPPQKKEQCLASMKQFRNALAVKGEPLSVTIINARIEERH